MSAPLSRKPNLKLVGGSATDRMGDRRGRFFVRLLGGQTIVVNAPIDTLPLFVRAGSIVPLGSDVTSTQETQKIGSLRVYPGANGSFTLYNDDGRTYAYENGGGSVTKLTWDDAAHRLSHDGASGPSELDKARVVVMDR